MIIISFFASITWLLFLIMFKPKRKILFGIPIFLILPISMLLLTDHLGVALEAMINVYFLLVISLVFDIYYYGKKSS